MAPREQITMLFLLAASASAYSLGSRPLVPSPRAQQPAMQYEIQAETVKVFGETQPYKFMTIQPLFTVKDWNKAKPIMEDFLARTRKDFSCMYSGWSIRDNQLFGRIAHVDGEAVINHLQSIGPCLDQLTADGVATLDEISLHGPAEELANPPPPPAGNGPNAATAELLRGLIQYYEIDSGISFITKEAGGVPIGQRLVTLQQTYTVSDWEQAKPLMQESIDKVESESGSIYFGWTKCGDSLFCREAYASAKGVLKHIDNVKDLSDALASDGIATLERTQIHGPMAQTQLIKDDFKKYGYGGPKPKSQFDTMEEDPRFKEKKGEEVEAAEQAAKEAAIKEAFEAAAAVEFFNIDSGYQRFEAVRLGGFEQ